MDLLAEWPAASWVERQAEVHPRQAAEWRAAGWVERQAEVHPHQAAEWWWR